MSRAGFPRGMWGTGSVPDIDGSVLGHAYGDAAGPRAPLGPPSRRVRRARPPLWPRRPLRRLRAGRLGGRVRWPTACAGARVRSMPTPGGTCRRGSRCASCGASRAGFRVRLADGATGWVHADGITNRQPASTPTPAPTTTLEPASSAAAPDPHPRGPHIVRHREPQP